MSISLEKAYLCVQCDVIISSSVRCPMCASEYGLLSVAEVFNRPARDLKIDDAEKLYRKITKVQSVFESCMTA